ncbi:alpha/beta fold hydrolase [Candidatus Thorarchaeota archaeon]|nr:MAG: alpha/beta fold hydrolase [Candidatus Thorarchaeota archaeon]
MSAREIQEHYRMTDGFNLFYRCWGASGEIKRVVVCIHGGGDHSGYFRVIGPQLSSDGNQVYAIDLRGFGNSQEDGLPRGDTRNFKRHLQDLDDTLGQIRRSHPGKKIYLLGHSMGGCYVLWYAANYRDSLDGLMLAAPAIIVRMLSTRKALIVLSLANLFAPRKMYDPFGSSYVEGRDPEVITTMLQDPLGTSKLSFSYLAKIRKTLMDRALKNASHIEKPTLVLQGEADISALPEGARRLYERLRTKDKSIQTFPDADHHFYDIFSSAPLRPKYDSAIIEHLFSVIMNWLNTH